MKNARSILLAVLLGPLGLMGASLRVDIAPLFQGAPLPFDSLQLATAEVERLSVTRFDFLLSEIALRRDTGEWQGMRDWQAFLSLRDKRDGFTLRGIPAGHYTTLRFLVGLRREVNHRDPAAYPASHPLNPSVNGLHWNWQGGYVFLALEGNWRRRDGMIGGYSHHLATDRMLMSVELPVDLDLQSDQRIELGIDAAKILSANRLEEGDSSTHSREGDTVAEVLRANVERSFEVRRVSAIPRDAGIQSSVSAPKIVMAREATLHPMILPAGFPRPEFPADNPLTEEGIELGRRLFEDGRLSANNRIACVSCHQPEHGFGDPSRFSRGTDGIAGTRNAMPLVNLAWKKEFFWDGRARSLREQVLMPVQNEIEMHETLPRVVAKLAASSDYRAGFQQAFGPGGITADRVARALEQYLLTLISPRAKFDRVMAGESSFSAEEQRGFELFHTEHDPRRGLRGADCFHCHGGPLFTNHQFANNGLDAMPGDAGRLAVTRNEADRGKFAVPSLRDVAVRKHFMHDGRFVTLEEVVEHYSSGVKRSATLDPNLAKHPDGGVALNAEEKSALAAFLKTLSSEPSALISQSSARDNSARRPDPAR